MSDENEDVIIVVKDDDNKSITIRKVQRCRMCQKIPGTNCICPQKTKSLLSTRATVFEDNSLSRAISSGSHINVSRSVKQKYEFNYISTNLRKTLLEKDVENG